MAAGKTRPRGATPGARRLRAGCASLALALAPLTAAALDVAGVRFADEVQVGGKPLVLNGAGLRHKAVFKVYAAGFYAPRKSASVDELLATATPKRLSVTMLRDIEAGELGKMFSRGMEDNMDRSAGSRLVPGIMRMSEVFSQHKRLREGERFQIDWVPGTGTVLTIKGETSEPFREPEFFQTLMRIWLGAKPADWQLKDALLGKAGGHP